LIFGPNPSQWWQPIYSKIYFISLKIAQKFLIFFRFGFGLRKAQLIFGPNPSQWWQPFYSKINFISPKIVQKFLIFFRFGFEEGSIDFWAQLQPVVATLPFKKVSFGWAGLGFKKELTLWNLEIYRKLP
jgi:hypothetical protein